ncbi:cellulose synthase/poly-beta-1,6-N-acetylglucosamine synthase-like glycosyltransferase [Planomicrobium sp. HSC-17F08]|nr:cellulose synthase/poly-beta-1,6-N-acetylglucosamine synthase-like glycosyltransferase [Planomicrobium sp. HSC-17F08]
MDIILLAALLLWAVFFSFQLAYLVLAFRMTREDTDVRHDLRENKMSILVPAYNEAKVLKSCFSGFKNLAYENFEMIIINDGSDDNSMKLLVDLLNLKEEKLTPRDILAYNPVIRTFVSSAYPNVKVLDKVNGGKADALNAGADYASGDIIITLDADSILQKNALTHINEAMQDPNVIAGGGMVHVGQMYKDSKPSFKGKGLVRYQLSDYMLSFYIKRFVQSKFGLVSVVSGAFGAFRAFALYEAGGYKKTIGEDMEITLNMQQLIKNTYTKGKLVFIPKAECYTEVPADYKSLSKQRIRWQKGFIDSLKIYRKDRVKKLGFKLVFFVFIDSILPGVVGIFTTFLLAYSIVTGGMLGLTLLLLAATAALQIVQRVGAYVISRRYGHKYSKSDYTRITLFSVVELVTYRVLDAYFFMYGSIAYLVQRNHTWNKLERTGIVSIYTNEIVNEKPISITDALPLKEAVVEIAAVIDTELVPNETLESVPERFQDLVSKNVLDPLEELVAEANLEPSASVKNA